MGDLFKDAFEHVLDLFLPAAARFFTPDLPSNPGSAQGFVEPPTDPEEETSTNNLPGITDQTELELQIINKLDVNCDPNEVRVSGYTTYLLA